MSEIQNGFEMCIACTFELLKMHVQLFPFYRLCTMAPTMTCECDCCDKSHAEIVCDECGCNYCDTCDKEVHDNGMYIIYIIFSGAIL